MIDQSIQISISPEILDLFPQMRISGIMVNGLTINKDQNPSLQDYLAAPATVPVDISAEEEIAKWRKVYGQMGVKPSKYFSSFESLYRRFSKGKSVFGINPVVDSYNAVSIKHRLCMGGYDAGRLGNHVSIRFAQQGEEMVPIGSDSPLILTDKAVVYADEHQVMCALWNHRDAQATMISDQTTNALFFVDEVNQQPGRAERALKDLADLLKNSTDSISEPFHLDQNTPFVTTKVAITETGS